MPSLPKPSSQPSYILWIEGVGFTGLWLAGNEGMEKNMETIVVGYTGTAKGIHSFIPSQPKGKFRVSPETLNPKP